MTYRKIIGERLPRPRMLRLGDVVAIPLSDGRFGYARKHHDCALGILNLISHLVLPLQSMFVRQTVFFISYCEPIDHPDWIYLGKWKFEDKDNAWGPAQFIQDPIDPNVYRIYDRGKMRSATYAETVGLDRAVLLFPIHVQKRIEEYFKRH